MADDKADLLRSLEITDGSREPRTRTVSLPIVLAIVAGALVLAGAGGWLIGAGRETPAASGGATTASTAGDAAAAGSEPARAATRPASGLVASGFVVARRQATVSAEINGRITDVLVEEGAVVEEGQILAELDATRARIALELAEATVTSREAAAASIAAELSDARRILARAESLKANDFSTEASVTQAAARVTSLAAQLRRAQADAEVARLDAKAGADYVNRHTIRAPFAGVVVAKNAQAGEIIAPSAAGGGFTRTGVATIVDMASLEIEVDVNEGRIERVTSGQPVEAVLDAYPDWRIPARVAAIIPTANRDRATIQVRVALDVSDPRILPEMAAKVTFLEDDRA